MLRIIALVFYMMCMYGSVQTQELSADSSRKSGIEDSSKLIDSLSDYEKMLWYKEKCWDLRTFNREEAYEYGMKALDLARDLGDLEEKSSLLNYLGVIQRHAENYDAALEHFEEALSIAEANNIVREKAYAFNNIGNIYHLEGEYELALPLIRKAIELTLQLDDSSGLAYCYYQMGKVMEGLAEIDSSLYYNFEALKIRENIKSSHVHVSLWNIGDIYHSIGNNELEKKYLLESMELSSLYPIIQGFYEVYSRLGNYYYAVDSLEIARKYYIMCVNDNSGRHAWGKKALPAQKLSEIYEAKGDLRNALKYSNLHASYLDSVNQYQTQIEIKDIALKYKFEREKDKIIEKQEQEARQIKVIVASLILGILLIAIFTSLLYRKQKIQRKTNIELERKNRLVLSQKEKLQNYSKELNESNRAKDKLFSIIAHDLRLPFNSILGISEILRKQIKTKNFDDIEEYSELLYKSSKKSYDLLVNLLEWSSSQTGKLKFKPEKFVLNDLIDEVIGLLEELFSEKNIKINNELEPTVQIVADRNMIYTVLRNLLLNAYKFSHPGGSVVIKSQLHDGILELQVADEGVGIKEDDLQNLFNMNGGTSKAGTNNEKGTGLGLILCKEFMEKHDGEIKVESEYGKGSRFTLSFPI